MTTGTTTAENTELVGLFNVTEHEYRSTQKSDRQGRLVECLVHKAFQRSKRVCEQRVGRSSCVCARTPG